MADKHIAFGERLKEIRKEMGLSQEAFADILGTSKQVLSKYETNQRIPKLNLIEEYAEKLNVSLNYMLGRTPEEEAYAQFSPQTQRKPFYKIFIDLTTDMGLDIPAIVRVTGLTDSQVRTIIFKRMKDAPLPLALLLSEKLGVPLRVWTGEESPELPELSAEAREVALAYEKATPKDRNIIRLTLGLDLI